MNEPVTIYWYCLHCPAAGITTGTESGADAKHVKEEGHTTYTSVREKWTREHNRNDSNDS